MNQVVKIEVPVSEATAAVLVDEQRLLEIGRLIDAHVASDRVAMLIAALEKSSAYAKAAGFTEADVEAELAAYNAERRG